MIYLFLITKYLKNTEIENIMMSAYKLQRFKINSLLYVV